MIPRSPPKVKPVSLFSLSCFRVAKHIYSQGAALCRRVAEHYDSQGIALCASVAAHKIGSPCVSKFDRPLAVEDGVVKEAAATKAEELHQTWRVYVRTGADSGVMYRTASAAPGRAEYNNRPVVLEDYLTPFKYMLNQANGVYRGAELANQTGKNGFVGAKSYYQQTKTANKGIASVSWDNVGIQAGTDAKGDYLEFTFLLPTNRFYAMYNVASDLYMPIPAAFFETIGGVDNYGNSSEDKSTNMLDNMLSVGPYYMATYEPDQLFTFKRNDGWWEHRDNPNVYKIDGIHERVLSAYENDKNVAIKAFLANELDAATLTDDYLEDYQDDPRATKVPGSSVFKLNVNSCDAATWEELFGENGSITQTAKADYWNCKPWMANENFVKGLFYSIDRENYANARGSFPTVNYFADAYQSNPEEGISYNSTPEHAAALADFWGDTVDTYGYDVDLSTTAFEAAIQELVANGDLNADSPDLEIDIEWMYQYQVKDEGDELAGYMEDAFNAAATELGYNFQLKVNNIYDGSSWIDVYYNHLMVGQFDLGFGSISGNSLDPLNFMEVLKSDNSSGMTLNWGSDTSEIDLGPNGLVWQDEYYSFDGLWDAADHGALLGEHGETLPWLGYEAASAVASAEGLVTISGTLGLATGEGLEVDVQNICGMMTTDYSDYYEIYPAPYTDYSGGYGDTPTSVAKFEIKDGAVEFEFTLGEEDSATAIANGAVFLSSDADIYLNGVYLGMSSAAWVAIRVDTTALPAPAALQLSGFGFDNIFNEVIR